MTESRVIITADAGRAVNEFQRFRSQAVGALEHVSKAGGVIGGVLGGIGASVSVAAFAGWIKTAIDATDAASDLSQKTGVAVGDIAGLEMAFQKGGMEAGAFESTMSKLSKQIVDGNAAFEKLGVKTKDVNGQFKNNKDMLYELADQFAGMEDGVRKTALAQEIFGKSGAAMIPMLNEGSEGLRKMDDMARKLGLSLSEEAVEQAGAFNDTLDLLGLGTKGIAQGLAAELLPTLSQLTGQFLETMTSGDRLKNTASFLAAGLRILYTAGVGIVEVFSTVGKTVGAAGAQLVALLQGNFSQAAEIGRMWKQDIGDSWAATLKSIDAAWDSASNSSVESMAKFVRHGTVVGQSAAEIAEQSKKATKAHQEEAKVLAELAGLTGSFAQDWDQLGGLYAKGSISLEQLTKGQADLLAKQPAIIAAAQQEVAARKAVEEFTTRYNTALAMTSDIYAKNIRDAEEEALRNEELARTFGMSKSAIEAQTIARLEEQLSQRAALGLTLDEIAYLEQLIATKKRNAAALGKVEQAENGTKALEELQKFLDPARAQDFGEALREAFGSTGSAIAKLTGSLDGMGWRQAEIAKQRENASIAYKSGLMDEQQHMAALARLSDAETRNRLSGYGDMASAAAGFFGEQSKGYQALMAVSKVFHAAELAMTLAELVPKGISAVLNQANGDPYTAFGRMAAMGALVAGLGVAIGGISGSGGSISKDRQASAGAGSVFGDANAKSESISKSLDMIEQAAFQELSISTGMLAALRNIENNISSFAALVVDRISLGKPIAAGSAGSAAEFGRSTAGVFLTGGFLGVALDKLTGGWVGKITGSILNKLFGGKKTVEDTGFTMDPIAFADIFAGRLSAVQYADVKKEGGLLSKDKWSTQMEGFGTEGNRQFALVLGSLYDAVFEAGKMLDLPADEFASKLQGFVVDIGKISLKDMKPDEVQKQLEAVFSKVGDDLARFGAGGLERFQQVGEGYLETLTRVATTYQMVGVVTDSLGMSFDAVGFQSIEARERLVALAGGLEQFKSSAEQFLSDFYTEQEQADALRARLAPTLGQFGIETGSEDSLKQFRNVVTGLDLTTAAGAQAYATLMQIAPAFKRIADVDAAVFEERADLQRQLNELTLTQDQLRAIEREGLRESNRAILDQIYAVKDLQAATDAATAAQENAAQAMRDAAGIALAGVDSAYSVLQRVVGRQKSAVQEQIALQSSVIAEHKALSSTLRGALDSMQAPGMELDARRSAQAQVKAALAMARAGGILPDAESMKKAMSVLGKDTSSMYATQADYLRDFYSTQNDIAELAGLADEALSIEELSLKAMQDEVDRLDQILLNAQQEIDVLKGIDTSVLSVAQAIQALSGAILTARANPQVAATASINQTYQSTLGRAPDAAGLQFWQDKAAQGVPQPDILAAIANSPEARLQGMYQATLGRSADAAGLQFYLNAVAKGTSYSEIQKALEQSDEAQVKLRGFAVGTNQVPYDMPAFIHEDERIIPAADNRELMRRLASPVENNTVLVVAVQQLTAENRQMRKDLNEALYAIAKNTMETKDFLDKWDVVGQPKTRTDV